MTGGEKSGDAKAHASRDKFSRNVAAIDRGITRLEIRAEMKSLGEDEISSVIDQRTLEAQRKKSSDPPADKVTPLVIVLTVARKFPRWGAVIVTLAALATYFALRYFGK